MERERAALVITGRPDVLSAGFDLGVMKGGGVGALKMLHSGFALTARLLSFPTPVVVASTGHAYAMGAFIVLSGDYRIGATGPWAVPGAVRSRIQEPSAPLKMPGSFG